MYIQDLEGRDQIICTVYNVVVEDDTVMIFTTNDLEVQMSMDEFQKVMDAVTTKAIKG